MERRVFLAILLSFAVLYGYQAFLAPKPAPRPAGSPAPAAQNPGAPAQVQPPPVVAEPQPPADAPATLVGDTDAREIVVDTDTVRAVFSTRGAVLTSWRLKNYSAAGGQPLDLVPQDLPAWEPRAFSLATGDHAIDQRLQTALYKPTADNLAVSGSTPATLGFEYRDAAGLVARKQFTLNQDAQPYLMQVTATIERGGEKPPFKVAFGPSLGTGYNTTGSSYYYPPAALYSDGADAERLDNDDITAQPRYHGAYRWAGVSDHYFLAAVIGQGQPIAVDFKPSFAPVPGGAADAVRTFVSWHVDAAADAPLKVFLGPKDFDLLKASEQTLPLAIDFGMFTWLVVPLLKALKWVNGYVGNYGWSIIVLTLLINAAMAPLRHKSLVSMRKLQKLQPEIKAIQKRYEKYKMTDPERQKMNTEMMNLYRERGVNPASGCVPMLLTMPVLFAFYALLSVAIELRDAPWIGWIRDLSSYDPLYITPVLMGGTMFWQQYITPSTADPVQQRMMLIMPIVFTVMFLWAPSGLVLYWLFSNLWAIGQQILTNRFADPVLPTTSQPPAVRRMKKTK
jgi:YidC/Oxa1 family membrane protein insertase